MGKEYKWDSKKQQHVDPTTGDAFTVVESEDFQGCLQRHKERRQTGGGASR